MKTFSDRHLAAALFWAALLAYPFADQMFGFNVLGDVTQVFIYMILALGLNVVVGFGGLLHLGYAAFFAIGAFGMAYLTSPQSPLAASMTLPFWPAVLVSMAITALIGFVVAAPTMRLRGDYLAIVTMGFGLMFDPIMRNFDDVTKAVTGLSAVGGPDLLGRVLGPEDRVGWYYLILAALAVVALFVIRLRDSRPGRALKAMREDPIAAQSCGINLVNVKLLAFVSGAVIAGLAGCLYASFIYTLNLAFPFDFNGSIMILAMVILGGVGSVRGAAMGGLVLGLVNLVATPKLISVLGPYFDLSKAQFLIFGLALVAMMLLRPEGLLPEKTAQIELHAEAID